MESMNIRAIFSSIFGHFTGFCHSLKKIAKSEFRMEETVLSDDYWQFYKSQFSNLRRTQAG